MQYPYWTYQLLDFKPLAQLAKLINHPSHCPCKGNAHPLNDFYWIGILPKQKENIILHTSSSFQYPHQINAWAQ